MLSNCSVKKMYRDGALYYVDLCFHLSSIHCLHIFWHAVPTSFYIFYFLVYNVYNIPYITKDTELTMMLSVALVSVMPGQLIRKVFNVHNEHHSYINQHGVTGP